MNKKTIERKLQYTVAVHSESETIDRIKYKQ